MRRVLPATAAVVLMTAAPALAGPATATRDGRTLTVSEATALDVDGQEVRVRGDGYDRSKGIYVAFCVDNGPGQVPTPCGGGADTEGTSGGSVWISDLPPAYGTGLARPYGDGGSFDVEIFVRALLRTDDPETEEDETVDCRRTRCAVVTRNDHTRSDDRSQDVLVPVSFSAAAGPAPAPAAVAPSGTPAPAKAIASSGTTGLARAVAVSPAAAASALASSAGTAPASPETEQPGVSPVRPPQAAAGPARGSGGDGGGLLALLLGGAASAAAAGGAVSWRRARGARA